MKPSRSLCARILAGISLLLAPCSRAAEPAEVDLSITNGAVNLLLPLISGIDEFNVLTATDPGLPFTQSSGAVTGYRWQQQGLKPYEFFTVRITPKDSNEVVAATLLNRLAYGQTPDELERIQQMGAQAWVAEQLAPETIQENLEIDRVNRSAEWQRVVVTGSASSSKIYIYMSGEGDCYLDDIRIVKGGSPDAGTNAVKNGDFESGLSGWTVSENLSNSVVVSDIVHSGTGALHVISSDAGESEESSIWRSDLGISGSNFTLSFWYKPGSSKKSSLVVRLSGSGIVGSVSPGSLATLLADGGGSLNDLTAWHILHAVQSKRQLLEVLLQFFENHFVTQQTKSKDYLDKYYDSAETDAFATNLEYRELNRWRQALLNPQCTFFDLLKISAESPAMIIYLDTVDSKGNAGNIANENYARELLELFTFGVDNGYDQNDITVMSRAWTGWSIRLVDPTNEFNPFAPQSTRLRPNGTNVAKINNLEGMWAFGFKPASHSPSQKIIFPGKKVPDRFGSPYAGRNYELKITPGGSSTNWQYITATGTASSSTIYLYLTGEGDCYIDDLKVVPGSVPGEGANAVANGTFDANLAGWNIPTLVSGSSVSTESPHSGSGALHLVSTGEGSSRGTALNRSDLKLAADQPYSLSYWYRPGTNMTGDLVVRLSGEGIVSSPGAAGTNSVQDGYTVLAHLADQPFTQEYLSVKLCRIFVHDDFATGYDFTDPNLSAEGKLVRDCMRAWEENVPKGQLRKVLDVIFNSELFRTQAASMQKVKTPLEFTVSAIRALRAADGTNFTANTDGYSIRTAINRMGRMRLFDRDTPDGYPEAAAPWISAGTLAERLRFAQALLIPKGGSGKGDATDQTVSDPVRLLKIKLPQASWNDATAVANYFASILFPAEGKANLSEYISQAVSYLNTGDDGASTSPFQALSNTTTTYDLRVRGMVAMLMTFPRFQEQ